MLREDRKSTCFGSTLAALFIPAFTPLTAPGCNTFIADPAAACYSLDMLSAISAGGDPVTNVLARDTPVTPLVTAGPASEKP